MQYVAVKVKRDTNTVNHKFGPAWEIPVLEFIFEDGNVEITDECEESGKPHPDAAFEFDRLTRAYGSDPQSGVPYVGSVYGQGNQGIRALKKAIEDAKAAEMPIKAVAPKSKPKRATEVLDALLG